MHHTIGKNKYLQWLRQEDQKQKPPINAKPLRKVVISQGPARMIRLEDDKPTVQIHGVVRRTPPKPSAAVEKFLAERKTAQDVYEKTIARCNQVAINQDKLFARMPVIDSHLESDLLKRERANLLKEVREDREIAQLQALNFIRAKNDLVIPKTPPSEKEVMFGMEMRAMVLKYNRKPMIRWLEDRKNYPPKTPDDNAGAGGVFHVKKRTML